MRLPLVALLALPLCAQIPAQDRRNTDVPNTDTHFRMKAYHTLAEWEARKEHLRQRILSAAGLLPMPERTPVRAEVFGRIEGSGYTIEKVLIETLPGFWLGGNLYRPLGKTGRLPAVASPHGHWDYGRLEHGVNGSIPARCINLARQGYIVLAYDMVGYNDTMIDAPHRFSGRREQLWSFGALGLQLWNSLRVVDYLAGLPEVDPARIGATGASGGGTQIFLLGAVDDRISFSAPVNMISAIMQGGCVCENAPNLRIGSNNMEIGALMAPRPMLMVSATGDWTRNTPREEFPAVQSIYRLYGKPGNVETVQFDAPHNYNRDSREAVYWFFARHALKATDQAAFRERNARIETPNRMLALHNRQLPAGALTFEQLFKYWISMAEKHNGDLSDRAAVRRRLALAFMSEWPAKVLSEGSGERIVLGRPDAGDRIPAIQIPGKGAPVVIVHPEGAEAARRSAEAREFIRAGRPVLLIDAFQTGAAKAPRDTSHNHFLTFNQSDSANRVQDILTALAYLGKPDIRLVGVGKAAVWCLFAAALAETPVELQAELGAFRGTDDDYLRDFFVPGIQRAGGLKAAQYLVR